MKKQIEIYVSVNGNDANKGTSNEPLRTPEAAQKAARAKRKEFPEAQITVLFAKGEYKTDGLKFTSEDSGTKDAPVVYRALDGEVVFNSGVTLDTGLFTPVADEMGERFSEDARKNILVFDLAKAGATKESIGPLCAIGGSDAGKYDDNTCGSNIEIFWNNERLRLARYPNEGFLNFKDVIDQGERNIDKRNPKGGTIVIDKDTAQRTKNWKELNKVWMTGYFGVDWSDSSSLIDGLDAETGILNMRYISHYGLEKGAEYYFYNIPEELDAPGEYYLDRDTLRLYVWPTSDPATAKVIISLSQNVMISAEKTDYITFEGLTFTGARNHCIEMRNCNGCTINNCTIHSVLGWAIKCSGRDNTVSDCEVFNTGKGGISLSGGDKRNFSKGNNRAINNYVHDWAKTFPMYNPGIEISGCGNLVAHNDIERSTHMAIYYDGADEIIEYNYINETVQQSNDAGAIYSGRDWTAYGCIVRYNIIRNTGNDHYRPVAIYWDDTESGQTAYGNIIDRSGAKGMLVGGGSDNTVVNNLLLDCKEYAILFDDRGRNGVIDGNWGPKGECTHFWRQLESVKLKESPWADRFPRLAMIRPDSLSGDDPLCPANPTGAFVKNNLIVYHGDSDVFRNGAGCLIEDSVVRFGRVENNPVFADRSECLVEGTFRLNERAKELLPEFVDIPFEKIGRYKT